MRSVAEHLADLLEQAFVWVVQVNEVVLLADQPPGCVLERDAAEGQLLLEHQRLTSIGGDDDLQNTRRINISPRN